MKNTSEFISTSEKLDAIALELYGDTYENLMESGRIINGIQTKKSSEKSRVVFKKYLSKYGTNSAKI